LLIALFVVIPFRFAGPATAADPAPGSVTVVVTDIQPNTPSSTPQLTPLTFIVQLTSHSSQDIPAVTLNITRGDPITTQSALDAAMRAKQPATPQSSVSIQRPQDPPLTTPLEAGQTIQFPVSTVSSTLDGDGLCICANAIYPIIVSAQTTGSDGSTIQLGSTQTYVPSFLDTPTPITVSWVWPLLERPHRLASDTGFIDDELTASVSSGGRLDRMLTVAESAAASGVPLTLVIDPELLDELSVMVSGYQVPGAGGTATAGSGGPAAGAWLQRLRNVIAEPGMEIALTPYANPDVDALAKEGLTWATAMPAAMQARVSAALGGHAVDNELSWPAAGALSQTAAEQLSSRGIRTLLLNVDSMRIKESSAAQQSPALVTTDSADLTAFSTPANVATLLSSVLRAGGAGLSDLPKLVAQVAMPAVVNPTASHTVLMLPDADLDPDVNAATRAILATAGPQTGWSKGVALLAASSQTPVQVHATLTDAGAPGLPAATVDVIDHATTSRPALASLFADPADAAAALDAVPATVQRLASQNWRTDPEGLSSATASVAATLTKIADSVRLVVPRDGSYTLGSSDSPLPITIENTLNRTVRVHPVLTAVGGVPGFKADDVGIKTIPPKTRLPLHIPVHVDRVGRIKVQVVLTTPEPTTHGEPQILGQPLVLSVRSTALGDIGTIIMWVAGVFLALALTYRLIRRLRRKPPAEPAEPSDAPEPHPAGRSS
jgi:hypothetical protein